MTSFALTAEQHKSYVRDGLLVLRGIVTQAARDRVTAHFEGIVDEFARGLVASGELNSGYDHLPFDRRWAVIRREVPAAVPSVWRRVIVSPSVYQLWFEPGLLGVARAILGTEIRAYDLFNGRPREPHAPLQTINWHQDAFNCSQWEESDSRILTCWVPLVPVDQTSGCLAVIPGSHRRGRLRRATDEFGIAKLLDPADATGDVVPVPMEPGEVLAFNDLVLHRSLDNISDRVRWSIDIRYSADDSTHRRKSPGGFRVSSEHAPPETFEEWAAKWDPNTGVMRRELRRLDLYAHSLGRAGRDVKTY